MEYLLGTSVIGVGYMLSKNGKTRNLNNKTHDEARPSESNIYENKYLKNAKEQEVIKANENFQKSRNAIETNIIPPYFNNKIFNTQSNPVKYLQEPSKVKIDMERNKQINKKFISSLSGRMIDAEEFQHNNMTPFFGGSVKQNTYEYANQPILELYTGTEKIQTRKREITPHFNPVQNINNVNGTQSSSNFMYDRMISSQKKTSELPFEKVMVGPGVGKGFTDKPSGGFHPDVREYAKPRGVDEMRVKTNPKLTFKGRIIAGKSNVTKNGTIGTVRHSKAPAVAVGPERYFTTVGAVTKPRMKSTIIMQDTNRKNTTSEHFGPGGPATRKKQKLMGKYRKSSKNIYRTTGPRNANMEKQWVDGEFHDYGKKNIELPANERDVTGKRSYLSNLTAIVKALVAPIQDVLRTTRKENSIENARQSGNFGGRTKHIAHDPNDTLRTTIKETNIHNNHSGHVSGGPDKGPVHDPNDIARTTIKETNIHNNHSGHMEGRDRGHVYDPNDTARTTIKETNIHDVRTGYMEGRDRGHVYDPNDIARTTIKETNIHNNHSGHMEGRDRGHVYDPNDTARTTIKETNIHDVRTGYMEGRDRGHVYDPNDVARTTIKETNIHDVRTGNMEGRDRGHVYDPNDIARTTIKETNIHNNHSGHMEGRDRGHVYDPNDTARTTIKETNIHNNHSGHLDGRDVGYVKDPADIARTTIKETNIHDVRTGHIEGTVGTKGIVYDKITGIAKQTIRETMDPEETVLNFRSSKTANIVYDPNDVARTTIKETNIENDHNGNLSGTTKAYVYDPNQVARTTIKETNIHNEREGNIGNLEGLRGGYNVTNTTAPNTQRQFTSQEYTGAMDGDVRSGKGSGYLVSSNHAPNTNRQFTTKEYSGAADSINSRPRSYDDVRNMTLNEIKEGTLLGRAPTKSNVSLTNGSSSINMEIKKLERDYMNSRKPNNTKIYNPPTNVLEQCAITNQKDQLNNEKIASRIEPDTLNAFRNNPFSQPLDSHAFS